MIVLRPDPSLDDVPCDTSADADADVEVEIDPSAGGRLSRLCVHGLELLVGRTDSNHPFGWGSYVMAPYAGRVRRGRFTYDGNEHELPISMPPHAIHGFAYDVPWTVEAEGINWAEMNYVFPAAWPFGGRVSQRVTVYRDRLEQRITVDAGRPMPATFGWHPWFVRRLGRGEPLLLDADLRRAQMCERDDDHVASGRLVPIREGPWDDAFIGVGALTLRWPKALSMAIEHDCSHVVIYSEPEHALCVEPQTQAPDAFNTAPASCVIEPGRPLVRHTTWRWR